MVQVYLCRFHFESEYEFLTFAVKQMTTAKRQKPMGSSSYYDPRRKATMSLVEIP